MRQVLDKIATLFLRFAFPVTVFLVPLFFLPFTPDFFDYNKNYLIFVIASLCLLAWTIRLITRRKFQITITPSTIPLLGLTLVYVASSLFQSPNPNLSLFGKTALVTALTIIFISTTSSQKNQTIVKSTITAILSSVFILNLLSLISTIDITPGFLPDLMQDKTFTPASNPYQLLSISLILLPATVYLAIKSQSVFGKIALFFIASVNLVTTISLINSLLTATTPYIWPFLPLSAGWSIMIDIFKTARTALLGISPENFLTAFTRLRPAYLNSTSVWNVRFTSSTDELLNVVTTTGILGGFFWISSLLNPILASSKIKTRTPQHTFTLFLLIGSILANLLVPTGTVLTFFTFTAITLVALNLKLDSDKAKDFSLNLLAVSTTKSNQDSDSLPQDKHPLNQVLIFVFTIPSIALIVAFWLFAGKAYAASLATYQAIAKYNTNAIESYNQQIKAYTLNPHNPIYRLNFAQTSFVLANNIASNKDLTDQDKSNISQLVQQAIREAKNATTLNPQDVTNWESLASLYHQLFNFAQGATDWAIASYNQAIILDPTNPLLRLDLGGIYYALQDYDQAIKIFGQAIDLKSDWPNSHYNLAAAYSANNNLKKTLEEMRIVVQLLDPNSADYQKAQNELSELEKLVQTSSQSSTTPETAPTPTPENIELVTPTPLVSPAAPIDLPEETAPNIPSPTPTTMTTPTPTATP